jgi:putative SOS response-associated peptidase YedK
MYNLITTNQAAMIALFRVVNRYVGNLAPIGVFPPAPVVRNIDSGTELAMMRWGMPPPLRTGGPPVTNIRNTSSPHRTAASVGTRNNNVALETGTREQRNRLQGR